MYCLTQLIPAYRAVALRLPCAWTALRLLACCESIKRHYANVSVVVRLPSQVATWLPAP